MATSAEKSERDELNVVERERGAKRASNTKGFESWIRFVEREIERKIPSPLHNRGGVRFVRGVCAVNLLLAIEIPNLANALLDNDKRR